MQIAPLENQQRALCWFFFLLLTRLSLVGYNPGNQRPPVEGGGPSMYGFDTGAMPILLQEQIREYVVRLDMTTEEAQEMSLVVPHVRAVRSLGAECSGEVCIPIVHGVFDKIKLTLVQFVKNTWVGGKPPRRKARREAR